MNQVLLGSAILCLVSWYVIFVWQLQIRAVDLQVTTDEDTPVELALAAKGLGDGTISFEIVNKPIHGKIREDLGNVYYTGLDLTINPVIRRKSISKSIQ